jgi:alkylhydroperoxidase family enzyme
MKPRLNAFATAPKAMQALLNFGAELKKSDLEKSLGELVKTRASQISTAAPFASTCISRRRAPPAKARNASIYSTRGAKRRPTPTERAALAWTEALTLVAETRAPDDAYDPLKLHFSEQEIVELTLLIGAINIWNRVNVAFRTPPKLAARAS